MHVYNIINESSLHDRTNLIENRNRDRQPLEEFQPQQQIFIKNPLASRQKISSRYTQDRVLADLPIHIYTSKKRGPVARSRLKRVPKSSKLLQDADDDDDDSPAGPSDAGDKT